MKEIPLTRGYVAIVDDEDYEKVARFKWRAQGRSGGNLIYASRSLPRPSKAVVLLHREILGAGPGEEVDHIDGDGLNCRRANLRRALHSSNLGNARKRQRGQTSQFKGVSYSRVARAWHAYIGVMGKKLHLGTYGIEADAARAYDAAARLRFGEFARLNFPVDGERSAHV